MQEYNVTLPNGVETILLLSEEHKNLDYPDAVPVGAASRARHRKKTDTEE